MATANYTKIFDLRGKFWNLPPPSRKAEEWAWLVSLFSSTGRLPTKKGIQNLKTWHAFSNNVHLEHAWLIWIRYEIVKIFSRVIITSCNWHCLRSITVRSFHFFYTVMYQMFYVLYTQPVEQSRKFQGHTTCWLLFKTLQTCTFFSTKPRLIICNVK